MATLHLMVGLPCSGKTTLSKKLEKEHNALRLTPDVWHIKLFGDNMFSDNHDKNHDNVEKIMWDVCERVLTLGVDVILDFGCWSRAERDDFRARAKRLGADFRLHYLSVTPEEIFARLEARNNANPEHTFVIPKEELEKYISVFQPPQADEL